MDFTQIQTFMFVLMSICGGIVAIAAAVAVVVKFYKWARKGTDENTDKLDEHYKWLASDKRRIESLESKQDEAEAQNKLMLKALVTLMSHELDGNHTKQLGEVRDEIQNYLIAK